MQPAGSGRARCREHDLEERPLRVVPDSPLAIDPLERAVSHALRENPVDAVAERRVPFRKDADIPPGRGRAGLDDETRNSPDGAGRDDVVEEDRVEPPRGQVGVGVHVVIVGDRLVAVSPAVLEEEIVRDGRAERPDAPAAEVLQAAETLPVGFPYGQDFAKLEVGDRGGEHRAASRRVLDAAHPDIEVAAGDGGVDRGERDLNEDRLPSQAARDRFGDLDIEAADPGRVARIRFDERRASFGVSAPPQDLVRGNGRRAAGRRGAGSDGKPEGGEEAREAPWSSPRHAKVLGETGRGSRARRKREKSRIPAPNPPTCAHQAIPLTSRCEAIASVPLKNCVRNQKPR